jgi:hypothetical protein
MRRTLSRADFHIPWIHQGFSLAFDSSMIRRSVRSLATSTHAYVTTRALYVTAAQNALALEIESMRNPSHEKLTVSDWADGSLNQKLSITYFPTVVADGDTHGHGPSGQKLHLVKGCTCNPANLTPSLASSADHSSRQTGHRKQRSSASVRHSTVFAKPRREVSFGSGIRIAID